jgi:hypothetical protein
VGGLDFFECFAQLRDTNNIEEITNDGKTRYQISAQGREVAETLSSDLLPHIRTRSLKSGLRYLSFKERSVKLKTDSHKRDDGKYDLLCSLNENGTIIMEIKLLVDNIERVNKMKEVFRDRPEHVYKCMLAVLTGEADYLTG